MQQRQTHGVRGLHLCERRPRLVAEPHVAPAMHPPESLGWGHLEADQFAFMDTMDILEGSGHVCSAQREAEHQSAGTRAKPRGTGCSPPGYRKNLPPETRALRGQRQGGSAVRVRL